MFNSSFFNFRCVKNIKCKGDASTDPKMSARCYVFDVVEKRCCNEEDIEGEKECSTLSEHRYILYFQTIIFDSVYIFGNLLHEN